MKTKDVIVNGILVAVLVLVLNAVWVWIGNLHSILATIIGFGVKGITVGTALAVGLGIELAAMIRSKVKVLK